MCVCVCCLSPWQLVANTVLFTSVNLSGLFVRMLTERAQRKAFLQARNCIEERLRMEDENEKQVRVHTNNEHSAESETHRIKHRVLVHVRFIVSRV